MTVPPAASWKGNRRVGPPRVPPELLVPPEPVPAGSGRHQAPARKPGVSARRTLARVLPFVRSLLGAVVVVATSLGVAWGARHYITTTPRFAVTDITVVGTRRRSASELQELAGLKTEANIFTVDLDTARARLLQDPWLRDVELARRLPGTLLLQVSEREAAALVALPAVYLVSREGEIFKSFEPGDPVDLPVVTGIAVETLRDDREGATRALTRALDLLFDYERAALAARAPLQEVHLAGDGSVSLVVGKSGVVVALGDPPYRRKLEQAVRVFGELDKQSAKPDAILLDNEARPDRVVVRMR